MAEKAKSHKAQVRSHKGAAPHDLGGLRFGSKAEADQAADSFLDLMGSDDAGKDDSVETDDAVNATYPPKRTKARHAR